MSEPTTLVSPGRLFTTRYIGHETAAMRSAVISLPFELGIAVLSVLCLVLMLILDNPWFAALAFVPTYSLFWVNLTGAVK